MAEFSIISAGYSKRRHDESEEMLFNVRTLAYSSVSPHLPKNMTIEKFMPLPSDKKYKGKKKIHEWATLPESEIAKKFGD